VTPRQPFIDQISLFNEAGANFGGPNMCPGDERGLVPACRLSLREALLLWQDETMEIGETLYVTNRDDFRKWLEENHKSKKEIWLIQYKRAAKKPSIDYVEAVEEALCFGWIDGLQKGMDTERYVLRFSPRRPRSNWTETNKERARRLIAQGKMMEAGRASLPEDF